MNWRKQQGSNPMWLGREHLELCSEVLYSTYVAVAVKLLDPVSLLNLHLAFIHHHFVLQSLLTHTVHPRISEPRLSER